MVLSTIGYEGSNISDFIACLLENDIDTIVDIREVPISRKRGFSKTKLAGALSESGLKYTHIRELGDPKPGREAARRGDYSEFRKIFARHMRTKAAKDALFELREIATQERVCLLCYERDPKHCHRSIVAKSVCRITKQSVRHIIVESVESKEIESESIAA